MYGACDKRCTNHLMQKLYDNLRTSWLHLRAWSAGEKMELTPCHTELEVYRQQIVQYNILGCFINTDSDFGAGEYAQTLQPVTWSVYCPI